jgi:hypothetical protein
MQTDYATAKARFESEIMEVTSNPPSQRFLRVLAQRLDDLNNKHEYLSLRQLHQYALDFAYADDGDNDDKRKPFLPRWLLDESRRQFTYVVNEPTRDPYPDNVYNLWSPPCASRLPLIADADIIPTLIEPILRHVREVLADGDEALAEFVLDFMCNTIQRPYQPAGVGLLVGGCEGCGKGVLFEFLRSRVLGYRTTLSTATPQWHLLPATKKIQERRYALVQIDEGFHNRFRSIAELLSERVTGLVCTSSHLSDVPASYAHLFVTLRCSMPTDPTIYFQTLVPHLRRDDVARAFYQFAMARDLTRYEPDFRRHTPSYLAEAADRQRMPRFMSALVNAQLTMRRMPAGELFALYGRFTGDTTTTATRFGIQLHDWKHSVRRLRTRTGIEYSINTEALRETLERHGLFDADAVLPDA